MDNTVVVGSASIDTVVLEHSRNVQLGGVVAYAGITFRRHGIDTVVVTNVERRHERILDPLRAEGLKVVAGDSARTTAFFNHVLGDNRWQEIPARADPIPCELLSPVLETASHIHLGPLHPEGIDQRVIGLLPKTDITVSLDIQGYVRRVVGGVVTHSVSHQLADALRAAHAVKATERELELVMNQYTASLSRLMDRYRIDEFIVTRARRGGFVRMRNGEEVRYTADDAPRCGNPVGAGDVFFAAYLVHRLHRRSSVSVSCREAAALAADQIAGGYIRGPTLSLRHFGI